MTQEVTIALIGAVVTVFLALVGIVTLIISARASAKSSKELALITAQNQKELALISAKQIEAHESNIKQTDVINEYHKEVNGRMGELLETTKALGKREGEAKAEAEDNPPSLVLTPKKKKKPRARVSKK